MAMMEPDDSDAMFAAITADIHIPAGEPETAEHLTDPELMREFAKLKEQLYSHGEMRNTPRTQEGHDRQCRYQLLITELRKRGLH